MPCLATNASVFALLRRIDEDLMKVARDRGCCHCGSVLHSANYPRKPRGCPPAAHPDCNTRLSLCCAGCRKRMTPDSVRFLGRRVWLAIVPVLRSSRATGACGRPAGDQLGHAQALASVVDRDLPQDPRRSVAAWPHPANARAVHLSRLPAAIGRARQRRRASGRGVASAAGPGLTTLAEGCAR